jgi:hypothetical protein
MVKIGLIDIEPKIFNTAYMQISQYHKNKGDTVGWWSPLTDNQFDHIYCSSLFDFTDKSEVPKRAITGGTGFDLTSRLSIDIEKSGFDYSIYPKCKTRYMWFSKGCIRSCPFCCVSKKEGNIYPCLLGGGKIDSKLITICDNNFFANPNLWVAKAACEGFCNAGYLLDFQGVDARLLTVEDCKWLVKLKHYKQIKIAWDNPKENILPKLKLITKYIKPYKLMCYVLIGYWSTPEEDLYRVESLRKLKIDPFAMPYNKTAPYQKNFARWVNHKATFKTVSWKDYKKTF